MKSILIISDNHGFYSSELDTHIAQADEVWHAGDIGSLDSIIPIQQKVKFRAVYGNIDDAAIRVEFDEKLTFECEGLTILMTHIGGYPGKYPAKIKAWIREERADLFICGHSHICKVMKDPVMGHWHINPGSYGHHGFHHMRTALFLQVHAGKLTSLQVIELGRRGRPDKEMT